MEIEEARKLHSRWIVEEKDKDGWRVIRNGLTYEEALAEMRLEQSLSLRPLRNYRMSAQ